MYSFDPDRSGILFLEITGGLFNDGLKRLVRGLNRLFNSNERIMSEIPRGRYTLELIYTTDSVDFTGLYATKPAEIVGSQMLLKSSVDVDSEFRKVRNPFGFIASYTTYNLSMTVAYISIEDT